MLVIRMIQAINNRILANKHTASNGMNSRSRVGSVLPKLYLIAFIILDLKGCGTDLNRENKDLFNVKSRLEAELQLDEISDKD